jgi:hypothetical protein
VGKISPTPIEIKKALMQIFDGTVFLGADGIVCISKGPDLVVNN